VVERDCQALERLGLKSCGPISRQVRSLGLRAWRDRIHGHELKAHIAAALKPLAPVLVDTMVAAHLAGRLRVVRDTARVLGERKKAAGAFDEALAYQQARLQLSDAQVAELARNYSSEALKVTRVTEGLLEEKAQAAVTDILSGGTHVQGGVARMREAFDAAGMVPGNPYMLENLVRTQTRLAYSAGQWNADQDPAVQEILWGYQYLTVGDGRVRPNHADMEDTRAPADHEIWQERWPPCGFSCRCSIAEIFNDDPPALRTINIPDGEPDEGWGFNPGMLFRDHFTPETEA
jgi:SPP1 gp7 family putative phage head morphogenesis protein